MGKDNMLNPYTKKLNQSQSVWNNSYAIDHGAHSSEIGGEKSALRVSRMTLLL